MKTKKKRSSGTEVRVKTKQQTILREEWPFSSQICHCWQCDWGGGGAGPLLPPGYAYDTIKLEDHYTLKVAKLMHNFIRNRQLNSSSSFFTPINAIRTRTTRLASSNQNLYVPLYQTKKLQRFFKFLGVSI